MKKVLIADDSPVSREYIKNELKDENFAFLIAENGKKAYDTAVTENVDLILIDIEMPIMNGFETCKALRENKATSEIPVIIITGNKDIKTKEKGFEHGAIEFFEKPFKQNELKTFINELFKEHKESKGRVLIIDDSEIMRYNMKYILSHFGFKVIEAENGIKAEEIINYQGNNIDCIMLDIEMPGMDGFETCKIIRKKSELRNTPIIAVTGNDKRDYLKKMFEYGANDYIRKPFITEELVSRVKAHLKIKKYMEIENKLNKELMKLNSQLTELAIRDKLTGLYNRRYLLNVLEGLITRKSNPEFSIILIDVDYFKNFNDNYGHLIGDEVLKHCCSIMKGCIANDDVIGRFGGEEFLIVLRNKNIEKAKITAEKIRKSIEIKPLTTEKEKFSVTVSIGVTQYKKTEDETTLFRRVDKALYAAKDRGRNKVIAAV